MTDSHDEQGGRTFSFRLPDLGEGTVESEVCVWHVKVGDRVTEDQVLAEVQTEKAVVEVGSPVAGAVIALGCAEGEVLAVGEELVRFTLEAWASAPAGPEPVSRVASERSAQSGLAPPAGDPAPRPAGATVLASPSLRLRAREAGIDLAEVPGSGPEGRISHADLDRWLAGHHPVPGGDGAAIPAPADGTVSDDSSEEIVLQAEVSEASSSTEPIARKLSGLRRVIARRMEASARSIPHYSYIEEVDVTELEALRRLLNERRGERGPRLTLLPFLVQALLRCLPDFPQCNAHFRESDDTLFEFTKLHLGVATMTPAGLTVPVLRDAGARAFDDYAGEIARLAAGARAGSLRPAELKGSTITITSLGALGGLATTPVINAPETTILGVNRMQERPVVRGGQIVVRTMMNLSASFDHRIVDGYDGARFVQALREYLEHPGTLFYPEGKTT